MAKGRRGLDSRHRDRSGKIEKSMAILGSDLCERNMATSLPEAAVKT
jgi:hypothetical protein